MAEPVLHVRDIPIRVRKMDADGVPQDVNMPPVRWQIGSRGVGVEETVDFPAREWLVAVAATAKKVRRAIPALAEVSGEQFLTSRMERVRAHEAVLSARDPDLAVSHVIELEEPGFAATQAVPVDEIEEQKIARASLRNPTEEALDFFPREVLDCFLISELTWRHSALLLRTAGDSNAFPHKRLLRTADEIIS